MIVSRSQVGRKKPHPQNKTLKKKTNPKLKSGFGVGGVSLENEKKKKKEKLESSRSSGREPK